GRTAPRPRVRARPRDGRAAAREAAGLARGAGDRPRRARRPHRLRVRGGRGGAARPRVQAVAAVNHSLELRRVGHFAKTSSTGVTLTFSGAIPSFSAPITLSSARRSAGFSASYLIGEKASATSL